MNLVEDVSTPRGEDVQQPLHLGRYFLRGATREGVLRVASPAPEGEVRTELSLQPDRVHPCSRDLHRVEDLNPGLNQVGDQGVDAAAGVEEDVDLRVMLADVAVDAGMTGFDPAAIRPRGNLKRVLGAQVIPHNNDLDVGTNRVQVASQVDQVDLGQLL